MHVVRAAGRANYKISVWLKWWSSYHWQTRSARYTQFSQSKCMLLVRGSLSPTHRCLYFLIEQNFGLQCLRNEFFQFGFPKVICVIVVKNFEQTHLEPKFLATMNGGLPEPYLFLKTKIEYLKTWTTNRITSLISQKVAIISKLKNELRDGLL